MKEYHKITTVFKRDPETKYRTLIMGEYAEPEFKYLKDNTWIFTEKIDGTNIRVMWEEGKLKFGGKTDNAQIPVFLYDKLNELFTTDLMKEIFPDTDACLYGEGYGAKIQKGGGNYIPDGVNFILFDVKIGGWWLKRFDVEDIAYKFELKTVPYIGEGNLEDMVNLVKLGFNSAIGKIEHKAEGVVARPEIELFGRNRHRIITKIKHKDFKEQQ